MSLFGFLFGGELPDGQKSTQSGGNQKSKACIYCGKPIRRDDVDGICQTCTDEIQAEEPGEEHE